MKSIIYKIFPVFLHDRTRKSPWIKSIYSELNITIRVMASELSGYCDVINNRFWRYEQNVSPVRETRGRWVKIVILSSFFSSLCRARNKIMYVFSWRTVSALTRVLFHILPAFILVCYVLPGRFTQSQEGVYPMNVTSGEGHKLRLRISQHSFR